MGKYDTKRKKAQQEEEALERSFRSMTPVKRSKRKNKKSHRKASVAAICVALFAVIFAVIAGYVYFDNASLDGIILDNVWVAGVDVGGMTQAQAIETVKAATSNTYSQTPMVVTVLDSKTELSPSWCGSLNVRSAVKAAYRFGNTGTESKRQEEQQIAMTTGYVVDITPYLGLDSKAIKDALAVLGGEYSTTLTETTYEVTGEAPNQTLVVSLGVPEYGLNLDELYQQVLDAYNQNTFFVEGKCGMIEPKPVDLQSILDTYYIAPVDAALDPKTYEIVEGKDGYGFDIEYAKQELESAKPGTTVEIPFFVLPPEITTNGLNEMLFRDELSTYTASSESDSNRDVNLALACKAIDGLVLNPQQVFSYNDALGERTASKGYKPGKSYSGNETVYTIGGGICQVSSALYYCAMVADLEILMRINHGFAPSYMPLGMDATVSWGSLDFRFRNNMDYPIRIEAEASEGNVTISIFGTDTRDHYVKMEYEKLNTYEYSTTYKTISANNAEGYKDGDYIVEPYTGYDIKTYRCRYEKETNKLISKDLEATSNYRKRDGVICKIEGNSSSPSTGNNLPGIGGGSISDAPGALPPE